MKVEIHDTRITEQPPGAIGELDQACWAREADGGLRLHSSATGLEPVAWRVVGETVHLARYPADLARLNPRSALDIPALNQLAKLGFPSDGGTCFEGVHRVPAGHDVCLDARGAQSLELPWWSLPPEPSEDNSVDLWGALVHQCEILMRSSPRAAVLLSGGIDSSAVAAAVCAAGRANGWPMPLFLSVRFAGLGCDESTWQDVVARHLGAELVSVDAASLLPWSPAQQICRRRATPLVDILGAAVAPLLTQAHERGCNLILSGFGADVLFQGDGVELDLLMRGRVVAVHRAFRGLARAKRLSLPRLWYAKGVRGLVKRRDLATHEELDAAGSYSRAWLRKALSDPIITWRGEMLELTGPEGITFVAPFCGAAFLQAFAGIRGDTIVQNGVFKGTLREAVRPYLPASVVDRIHKANFFDYHRVWIEGERQEMAKRYRELRSQVPPDLLLPADLGALLNEQPLTSGLITAWISLGVLEFAAGWDSDSEPSSLI